MLSKSGLAVFLSRLRTFQNPKLREEQYPTDSEIAAEALWFAYMQGDVKGKTVADLGCGTGILGIGCALLGARKVLMVERDRDAAVVARENAAVACLKTAEIVEADIADFCERVDTVVQNPPFGTKTKHADKAFLEKAFAIADVVYSFHKTATAAFVEKMAKAHGFAPIGRKTYDFPLKASYRFHRHRMQRIAVDLWQLTKV